MRTSDSRIAIFVNPRAGRGRAKKNLPKVLGVLNEQNVSSSVVETSSRSELQERARCAIADGIQLLVALGGDGTAQGLIQEAMGHDVAIGLIPSGGGNDFAAALGVPNDPLSAAKVLLDGVTRTVDLALAITADGCSRIFLGGGGIGLDAETIRFADQHYRKWPGRWRYVASALHAYKHFKPMRVRLEPSGQEIAGIEQPLMIASVLNTPTFGAGIRLAPEACIDDGILEVVTLEYLKFSQILALLPRLMRRGEIKWRRIGSFRVSQVRLIPDRPCLFHGDGEIFGPAPVEIRVLHEAAKVLVPRSSTQTKSSVS